MQQKPSDHLNRYLELKKLEIAKTFKNSDTRKKFDKQLNDYMENDDPCCDWIFYQEKNLNIHMRKFTEDLIIPESLGLELQNIYYAYLEAMQNEATEELVDGMHKAIQFFKRLLE